MNRRASQSSWKNGLLQTFWMVEIWRWNGIASHHVTYKWSDVSSLLFGWQRSKWSVWSVQSEKSGTKNALGPEVRSSSRSG
mmetsp:Transcript_42590/g.72648  ORF Transcript_42590/g.72648 Transcript_42590/m.72648 type:complete len:81 (-) Transcript_42590:22-264(-)